MKWFLLRDRRHLGPFESQELFSLLQEGNANLNDYLLRDDGTDESSLRYHKISEVFPDWQAKLPASHSKQDQFKADAGVDSHPEAAKNSDRFLGSFSEDEILSNEVSRIFAEELDSTTLIKKIPVPPPIRSNPNGPGNLPPSPMRGKIRRVGTPSVGQPLSFESDTEDAGTSPKSAWWILIPAGLMGLSLLSFPFWPGGNPLTKWFGGVGNVSTSQRPIEPGSEAKEARKATNSSEPSPIVSNGRSPAAAPEIRVPEVLNPQPSENPPSTREVNTRESPDSDEPRVGRRSAKRNRFSPGPADPGTFNSEPSPAQADSEPAPGPEDTRGPAQENADGEIMPPEFEGSKNPDDPDKKPGSEDSPDGEDSKKKPGAEEGGDRPGENGSDENGGY